MDKAKVRWVGFGVFQALSFLAVIVCPAYKVSVPILLVISWFLIPRKK